MTRRSFLTLIVGKAAELQLPVKEKSVRFALIGDSGTGERRQFEVGRQLADYRRKFRFDFVLMLGDNIYGAETSVDFQRKFEEPYKPLLDGGVKFYASLVIMTIPMSAFTSRS